MYLYLHSRNNNFPSGYYCGIREGRNVLTDIPTRAANMSMDNVESVAHRFFRTHTTHSIRNPIPGMDMYERTKKKEIIQLRIVTRNRS